MRADLFRVLIPIDDMSRADDFYGQLLGLEIDDVTPTRHYLRAGQTILVLANPGEGGRTHRPNPDWLYLRVADVEATYRRAQSLGLGAPGRGEAEMPNPPISSRSGLYQTPAEAAMPCSTTSFR